MLSVSPFGKENIIRGSFGLVCRRHFKVLHTVRFPWYLPVWWQILARRPVAVQRVGGQVEALSWNTADGFAASINAFSAQNYGAGKMDRIRKGYWIAFRTIAAWGCLIMALFFIFPEPLSEIFFHEAEAIQISSELFPDHWNQ